MRKCRQCGQGFRFGLFSGFLLGRPKLIPGEEWLDLQSIWARSFDPSGLSDERRTELAFAFQSLREFSHGYDELNRIGPRSPIAHPNVTFYVNSLRHYCASLFLVEPRRNREANLRTVLDRIGDADLLSEVDRILDARLGKVTFAEFLRRYRNKFLVHELFQAGPLLEYFRQQDFDVEIDENWQVFNALEDGLFLETKGILRGLADLYPELWEPYDI